MRWFSRTVLVCVAALASTAAAREPAGLDRALEALARQGKFSGAVVVRGPEGVRFARGYGWADPFEKRRFTPDTPVDSGSLAKPVTSAAVLVLARDGIIDLDSPVQRYLPEYPHPGATVRHLLSHSAGLRLPDDLQDKSNAQLLAEAGAPRFPPGSAYTYCNLCSITLAILIERVTGEHYLEFVKRRVFLPPNVTLRPARLADWKGRAIGYRRTATGGFERFDSWEGERFYGAANLSISAVQMADWGREWWGPRLQPIRRAATAPARIGGHPSGLSLGNWYCAPGGRQCHYLGHHEGLHHMLYWDSDRRISVAMVTNDSLSPGRQQPVQRALVAFARADRRRGERELAKEIADVAAPVGRFRLGTGEIVAVLAKGEERSVLRRGVEYPAYPVGSGLRYVPGLDLYIAGGGGGRLRWVTLYEDQLGTPQA